MKKRIQTVLEFIAARLSEQSTWQGVGFLVALTGAKYGAGLDWGQAAGLGGVMSAALKMIFPDQVKP
ncbi:hypothetical protein [Massilia sp. 9096]|uniref:hypothetical protein n=1 Tax=Massilia sp. 9096 TaxID=1500894 RepID=UPI000AA586D8|nr:hypothetical protein [Massilia sp. 9096]